MGSLEIVPIEGSLQEFTVVDLFSGAGGMSCGFHAHDLFSVIGAVDAQVGKPSSGRGSLECNRTFEKNIRVKPFERDLSDLDPAELASLLRGPLRGRELDVLSSCAPCTGFSRANPQNHVTDDARNSLVGRTAEHMAALRPRVLVMENARELLQGSFRHHFDTLKNDLASMGYTVSARVHTLSDFGLPQKRERALIIAAREDVHLHSLEELWGGWSVRPQAVTVRHAISHLPRVAAGQKDPHDPMHVSPALLNPVTRERMSSMPHDGGSWPDLRTLPKSVADRVLTRAMQRNIAEGKLGSHPDVYGRMWWDRPAPTIKRECAHVGNGRYSHPEQDRLCSVRELALLSGFPGTFVFQANSLANMYRHIGDAVPPLISHQIAHVVAWMLTGNRPAMPDIVLPGTSLRPDDLMADVRVQLEMSPCPRFHPVSVGP